MKHKQFSGAVRGCVAAALLTTICLVSFTARAFATEVLPLSLTETVRQADAIVLGTVTAKQSRWGDGTRRWMMTDYSFSVERVIYPSERGEAISQTITLSYWGGTINGETHATSDVRLPAIGERLVVMLRPNWRTQAGFAPVIGLNKGLFVVSAAPDGTESVRDADGLPLALGSGGQVARRTGEALAQAPNVDLTALMNWISTNVSAIKAGPSELPPFKDPRAIPGHAKTPASSQSGVPGGWSSPLIDQPPTAPAPRGFTPPVDSGDRPGIALARPVPQPTYASSHQAHLPIVVNNFPASFAPWSPEDQYQMSKWNYYASDVFRVYTTPTGTFSWGDGVFDLDGWPSSADMLSVYGAGWDPNTIGVTNLRYDSLGWIIEADIALNPAWGFTLDDEWFYNGGSARSFRQVMVHELGHMHGLDHDFNFLSVMNDMTTPFRAFSFPYMDDAAGIRAEYPSNAVAITDLGVYLYYGCGSQCVTDATYPSSVVAGNTLTVNNYHIENVGTTTIPTTAIEWYLSTARNYNGSYVYIGTSTYGSLSPFTYFTPSLVSRTFTVPASLAPGNYYLGAYIRNDGGAGQSSFAFSNNFAFSRLQIRVDAALLALTVSKNGTGSGTVTSSPSGINCGSTCTTSFTQGTNVTLNAAAASGSAFAGWSGEGCSGTGTCVVSMTQARNVAASFSAIGPPTVGVVTPINGTGSIQTFSVTYSDGAGTSDLNQMYLVFNSTLNAAGGCLISYQRSSNSMYLFNDAGNNLVAGVIHPGAAGTLSNSQCSIGNAGAVTLSGNDLTLPVGITFTTASFAGTKNVYAYVVNNTAMASGWQLKGTWTTAVSQAPTVVSVTPINGTGASQIFTAKFAEANGASDLSAVYLLINPTLSAPSACLMVYLPSANALYLFNDAGTGLVPGFLSLGTAGTLANSQCTVGNGGAPTMAGNQLTMPVSITFATAAFAGVKNVFAYAANNEGMASGWQVPGTWTTAAAQAPTVVSVTPINGTGASATFNATYSEVDGVSDLSTVYLLFNSSLSASSGCLVLYYPTLNAMYLYNDAGTGLVPGSINPGVAGTISNSQCVIGNAGATTTTGIQLKVPVAITFSGTFTGIKTVFAYAANYEGLTSGWQTEGTWTH